MGNTWELLAKTTLSSDSGTIRVPASGTFAARDRLYFEMHIINSDVSLGFDSAITFNDDTGNNGLYGVNRNLNGTSNTTNTGAGNMSYVVWASAGVHDVYVTGSISNMAGEKHIIISRTARNTGVDSSGSSSLNAVDSIHISARYDDTDRIQSITLSDSGDNLGEGSTIAVFALDSTQTHHSLPNGAIFEDTTDGNHYMWNGTDTWNEVT